MKAVVALCWGSYGSLSSIIGLSKDLEMIGMQVLVR